MKKTIEELRYDIAMASAITSVLWEMQQGKMPQPSIVHCLKNTFEGTYHSVCMMDESSFQALADSMKESESLSPHLKFPNG